MSANTSHYASGDCEDDKDAVVAHRLLDELVRLRGENVRLRADCASNTATVGPDDLTESITRHTIPYFDHTVGLEFAVRTIPIEIRTTPGPAPAASCCSAVS